MQLRQNHCSVVTITPYYLYTVVSLVQLLYLWGCPGVSSSVVSVVVLCCPSDVMLLQEAEQPVLVLVLAGRTGTLHLSFCIV